MGREVQSPCRVVPRARRSDLVGGVPSPRSSPLIIPSSGVRSPRLHPSHALRSPALTLWAG